MGQWRLWVLCTAGLFISCAAGCSPGERKAITGSCKNYLECNGQGQFVLKSCGFSSAFDASRKGCEWSWKVACPPNEKECEDSRFYSHPDSSRLYYVCNGGRLTLNFCPAMQVFDPSSGKCRSGLRNDGECTEWDRRAVAGDCSTYEVCQQGAWQKQTCQTGHTYDVNTRACEAGSCRQCVHGELTRGSACNRYQECSAGVWAENKCPLMKRFDPIKKKCVWSWEYSCPPETTTNAKLGTACEQGQARTEEDCSTYSVCNGGEWQLQTCPKEYLFDYTLLDCRARDVAKCASCPEDHASKESCGAYYTCVDGKEVPQTCGFLKRWDGVSKKCVVLGFANCFPQEKCSSNGEKVDMGDCKSYKECISGNYYHKYCPFSHHYDAEGAKCVWAWPWTKCEKKTPTCSQGETKLLDCTHYAQCVSSQWEERECETGKTFLGNECVARKCSVSKTSCRNYTINGVNFECVAGEIFDEKTGSCITGSCSRSKRAVVECQEGDVEGVEGSCRSYRVCANGQFVNKTCSDCMNFDPDKKTCRSVLAFPCKRPARPNQPTTAKPTDKPTQEPTELTTGKPTDATWPSSQPPATTEKPTDATWSSSQPPATTGKPTDATWPSSQPPATTGKTTDTTWPSSQPPATTENPTDATWPSSQSPATTEKPTDLTTVPSTTASPGCKEKSKKPDKENCSKYLECKNGKYERKSCWWPWNFDSVKLECVLWGAQCA